MKQRTVGSHSTSSHCCFKLFSSYWGRREQYIAHTYGSTVSSFSRQNKEEKSKSKDARRRRAGVKDIDSTWDKVPYLQSLSSSLLLYDFDSGVIQNVHQHDLSWRQLFFVLSLWIFNCFSTLFHLPAMFHKVEERWDGTRNEESDNYEKREILSTVEEK